jgi:hypothetical protein
MATQPCAISSRNRAALVFSVMFGKARASVAISVLRHAQEFHQMMDVALLIESPNMLQNLCAVIAAQRRAN